MGKWFAKITDIRQIKFMAPVIPFNDLMAEMYEFGNDAVKLNAIADYMIFFAPFYTKYQIDYFKKEMTVIVENIKTQNYAKGKN